MTLHSVRPAPVGWRTGGITTTGITPSQGDKALRHSKTGQAYMAENGANEIRAFRRQVAELVRAKYPGLTTLEPIFPKGTPVGVRVFLRMPLLKSQIPNWKDTNPVLWHSVAKDADKMFRAIGDALTEAKVWADDGQCAYQQVLKIRHRDVGAVIEWRELT